MFSHQRQRRVGIRAVSGELKLVALVGDVGFPLPAIRGESALKSTQSDKIAAFMAKMWALLIPAGEVHRGVGVGGDEVEWDGAVPAVLDELANPGWPRRRRAANPIVEHCDGKALPRRAANPSRAL